MSLFHYTNINARNSIKLNNELWLSKTSHDYLEPIININNSFRGYSYREEYKHLIPYFEYFDKCIFYKIKKCINNSCLISFRTDRIDDYDMFQNFCKSSGVCIEFYKNGIIECIENEHGSYHTVIHNNVTYSANTPLQDLFLILDSCYKDPRLKFMMDNNMNINDNDLYNVVTPLLFTKHEVFKNEKEYRFVIMRDDSEPTFTTPIKVNINKEDYLAEHPMPYRL